MERSKYNLLLLYSKALSSMSPFVYNDWFPNGKTYCIPFIVHGDTSLLSSIFMKRCELEHLFGEESLSERTEKVRSVAMA